MGGDRKGPSIFLIFGFINKQDVLFPNKSSKIVYNFFYHCDKHFKSKTQKYKIDSPYAEKTARNKLAENHRRCRNPEESPRSFQKILQWDYQQKRTNFLPPC